MSQSSLAKGNIKKENSYNDSYKSLADHEQTPHQQPLKQRFMLRMMMKKSCIHMIINSTSVWQNQVTLSLSIETLWRDKNIN